jgi:hypothetical protein
MGAAAPTSSSLPPGSQPQATTASGGDLGPGTDDVPGRGCRSATVLRAAAPGRAHAGRAAWLLVPPGRAGQPETQPGAVIITGKPARGARMSGQQPRWPPLGPPAYIVIYPDPGRDCWRHARFGPEMGFLDGFLEVPASASPDQARHAAEIMLADVGRTYFGLHCSVDWRPPDDKGVDSWRHP